MNEAKGNMEQTIKEYRMISWEKDQELLLMNYSLFISRCWLNLLGKITWPICMPLGQGHPGAPPKCLLHSSHIQGWATPNICAPTAPLLPTGMGYAHFLQKRQGPLLHITLIPGSNPKHAFKINC
jgi:hypothetical protein